MRADTSAGSDPPGRRSASADTVACRNGPKNSSPSNNMTTAPVWIIGASRSAARRLVATINMPCSIVRPKNTNESAASTVIACPAMARGMPMTLSADTRGKRDAGMALRPTANSANSVRSPHSRPADSTRVATGSGPSTKTSRRFGNSVSHITTDDDAERTGRQEEEQRLVAPQRALDQLRPEVANEIVLDQVLRQREHRGRGEKRGRPDRRRRPARRPA